MLLGVIIAVHILVLVSVLVAVSLLVVLDEPIAVRAPSGFVAGWRFVLDCAVM